MNFDGRRIGVARFAAILPGVGGLRRLDKEPRRGDVATLLGYHRDTAPGTVVAQNMLVVVPKDVSWWLRAEVYGARQIYRASRANVQIRPTEYRRCRYDNVQAELMRLDGDGGDLTFVESLVSLLRPFYAKSPFRPLAILACILSVKRLESLIARVGIRPRR